MISRATGEATFSDFRVLPPARLPAEIARQRRCLSVGKWFWYDLGHHDSEYGTFEIEVVCDAEQCIRLLLLSHWHSFYERDTPFDSERRVTHEGIISSELGGQREFSWGEAFCSLNTRCNKDWLVLAYSWGPHVPGRGSEVRQFLSSHVPERNNQ